jgi:hypothetical protein
VRKTATLATRGILVGQQNQAANHTIPQAIGLMRRHGDTKAQRLQFLVLSYLRASPRLLLRDYSWW